LTQLPRVPTNWTINPKLETLNPTQELLKKKLSANLRAKNPTKERASEDFSVEIDELIGSGEELFFAQELGPRKDELSCIRRVFATLKTAQEVARAASKFERKMQS
jgi:hypothetical protein